VFQLSWMQMVKVSEATKEARHLLATHQISQWKHLSRVPSRIRILLELAHAVVIRVAGMAHSTLSRTFFYHPLSYSLASYFPLEHRQYALDSIECQLGIFHFPKHLDCSSQNESLLVASQARTMQCEHLCRVATLR
jgi:hypothetical protein